MSRKRSLQNSVFIVNDNCTENNKNDLFPLTLPNSGCQRATGNWKSYRNYSGSYTKAIGRSSTGLQSQQILLVQQFNATNGLPSVKDSKRRRQRRFSAFFGFFTSAHQFKQKHSSANSSYCARCARCRMSFYSTSRFRE